MWRGQLLVAAVPGLVRGPGRRGSPRRGRHRWCLEQNRESDSEASDLIDCSCGCSLNSFPFVRNRGRPLQWRGGEGSRARLLCSAWD
uniref:Uncharacterized protein n=1 Tax=Arundo donax TaxID=35708 RepID=A0A0A9F2L9_ARUDO